MGEAEARVTRIVLLGTGTEVGKTWVATSLCRTLRELGLPCVGLKPVESGYSGEVAGDADRLALASEAAPPPPFRFREPVSPHRAARKDGKEITLQAIGDYVEMALQDMSRHAVAFGVIETAGGLFTPLGPGLTNWSLANSLDPSIWVLVAPDSLGVLHDVTATLEAARARGRAPDFVVLSASRPTDASSGTNAAELETLGIARPITTLRPGDDNVAPLAQAIITLASELSKPT